MKTTNIKTLAAALAAIISVGVLTSCTANTAQTNPEPPETTIATTSQTTTAQPQTTSAKETTTPSSTNPETQTEKTTAPTSAALSTAAPASTAAASTTKPATESTTKPSTNSAAPASTTAPAPEWTESAVSGTRYVNTAGIYSRNKAVLGAPTVKQYSLNDAVEVVAVTNTGYYKLTDGNFIHADYLGADKVTVSTTKPSTSNTAPTTSKPAATTKAQSTTTKPASTQSGTKEEQARAVAKKIAAEVKKEAGEQQSLEQIWVATKKVYNYTNDCVYDINNPDALTAYGAFIANTATCQGVTDALGMVLDELGYTWEHLCKNQYTHQCALVYFNYDYDEDLKKHPEYKYLDDFFIADENNWRTGAAVYADAYVGVMTL